MCIRDRYDVSACTDVTGFGLLGHGAEMATASGVCLNLDVRQIPYFADAVEYAKMGLIPAGAYKNRGHSGQYVDIGSTCLLYTSIEKNSGVLIKSVDNAKNFLQQQKQTKSIQNLKRNILDSVERQQQEIKELYDYLTEMIDQIERYRSTNPFIPYEIVITDQTPYLDRTVGEAVSYTHLRES